MKRDVTLKNRLINVYQMIKLNQRFIFSQRFLYFFGGVLIYFLIIGLVNYFKSGAERMGEGGVFIWLLVIPGIALVFYPSMSIVASEIENRTIEMIFSTAESKYRVWLARIGAMYIFLALIIFLPVVSG